MEQKASILVVDDNISLCKTISFVLGRKGYAVTTARDGLEAMEKLEERLFGRDLGDFYSSQQSVRIGI